MNDQIGMAQAMTAPVVVFAALPLAAVENGRWHWGLGDPGIGAVAVTALYLAAAIFCLLAAVRRRRTGHADALRPGKESVESFFWLALAGITLLLGINKQADLQSLLTLYGRSILKDLGLYESRRLLQLILIVSVTLAAVLATSLTIWWVRGCTRSSQVATAGLGLQLAFVCVRAASFHHLDRLLRLEVVRLESVRLNLVFESVGLFIILLSAMKNAAQKP